jgi:hypothetical protein
MEQSPTQMRKLLFWFCLSLVLCAKKRLAITFLSCTAQHVTDIKKLLCGRKKPEEQMLCNETIETAQPQQPNGCSEFC